MFSSTELIQLGKNIADLRRTKGLSQDALAFYANIGSRTISRIEMGQTDSRFTTLCKIARTLEIDLTELIKNIK